MYTHNLHFTLRFFLEPTPIMPSFPTPHRNCCYQGEPAMSTLQNPTINSQPSSYLTNWQNFRDFPFSSLTQFSSFCLPETSFILGSPLCSLVLLQYLLCKCSPSSCPLHKVVCLRGLVLGPLLFSIFILCPSQQLTIACDIYTEAAWPLFPVLQFIYLAAHLKSLLA